MREDSKRLNMTEIELLNDLELTGRVLKEAETTVAEPLCEDCK